MQLNKIYNIDVLEGLRYLPDESIDLIITSPPYNKNGLNKAQKCTKNCKWLKSIDYGGDSEVDNLPEDVYQDWQVEVLNECYRVLKKEGSMFYNHKNRIRTGTGTIVSPYEWLYRCKFNIRQEIIWDRLSTNNVDKSRYLPTTEKIFWLTKCKRPNFSRELDTRFKTEVWRFPFEKSTKHPAPFPIDLPDNIISCYQNKEDIVVLDPFMGSGTTALSDIKNGCKGYIGFEKFQEYIDLSYDRITELQGVGEITLVL